ncbi:MAG TPA: hypothetical protein PLV68_04410, partial [Ilumatobacteraceae bacterium]|nr:hypothetical protein [Ilumatobacteraceae bacterium]
SRQSFAIAYTSTVETRVMIAGLDNPSDPNDFDRKVNFDATARVTYDYQAANATSSQTMVTETRWHPSIDRA